MGSPVTQIDHYEKMVRYYKLAPIGKWTEPDGTEILIAEGFVDTTDPLYRDYFREYPAGLYQTAWGIYRGKMDIASWLEFDRYHDPDWPEFTRRRARINSALAAAREWIRMSRLAQRYR